MQLLWITYHLIIHLLFSAQHVEPIKTNAADNQHVTFSEKQPAFKNIAYVQKRNTTAHFRENTRAGQSYLELEYLFSYKSLHTSGGNNSFSFLLATTAVLKNNRYIVPTPLSIAFLLHFTPLIFALLFPKHFFW